MGDKLDDKLNNLRGGILTDQEVQQLLALALTLNRYVQQPWYKKIRRVI